jgi:succinoglycan biosynthesis transport protein ExoP
MQFQNAQLENVQRTTVEEKGLAVYWRIARKRVSLISLICIVCLIVGYLSTLASVPVFQARNSLEVIPINDQAMTIETAPAGFSSSTSMEMHLQTQVELLQSETLIDRVSNKIGHDRLRRAFSKRSRLAELVGLSAPAPLTSEGIRHTIKRNLHVRPSPRANLVEVLFDAPDAALAADVVNTLAAEYVSQSLEIRWDTAQRTAKWLSQQVQELKVDLVRSEAQLQDFGRKTGLLITAEANNVEEVKLRQLQEELTRAQADRMSKQSLSETAQVGKPESLPIVLDNGPLRDYQVRLSELRRQLAESEITLAPGHYAVRRIKAQIAELEGTLQKERANVIGRISNEFAAAKNREQLLSSAFTAQARALESQGRTISQYNTLKREVDTNRTLYDTLLQKTKEAGVASAMRAPNLRVVDQAYTPSAPYKPDVLLHLALGLGSGLLISVATVALKESNNKSLQAPGDTQFYFDVPELGVVPSANPALLKRNQRLLTGSITGETPRNRLFGRTLSVVDGNSHLVELASSGHEPTPLSDAFRDLVTSILLFPSGRAPRTLLFTSPAAGDGKTTVVSNVAIVAAQLGRRVLLIDGDTRAPRLHRIFQVTKNPGLTDLLEPPHPSPDTIAKSIKPTPITGLSVMPCGRTVPDVLAALSSARVPAFMSFLKSRFDLILIDAPPLLAVPEARALTRLAEAVVLVVRAGSTTGEMTHACQQRLVEDKALLLGTVLNDWKPEPGFYAAYSAYGRSATK